MDSPVINNYIYTCRERKEVLCLAEPLTDSNFLEKAQNIEIKWPLQNRTSERTNFQFTYKPNPSIETIQPNKTIIRYM